MIVKESEEKAEAAEILLRLERAQAIADSRDHAEFGRRLCELDKFKEGEAKREIEIAKNFLAMGVSACDISKGTGLSTSEIEKLKEI